MLTKRNLLKIYLNLHINTQLCRDYVLSFESRTCSHLQHRSDPTLGSVKLLFVDSGSTLDKNCGSGLVRVHQCQILKVRSRFALKIKKNSQPVCLD